jgi:hypothetical protein
VSTTRRDILKATAAAGVLSPLSRLRAAPRQVSGAADGSEPMRAVWWFYPSFLEHPEGPFGVRQREDESPLRLWKACLSWLADRGVNAAFIHFGPFGGNLSPLAGDRIRTGWGFHYLLDFERFPEARTFDRDTLARNRDLLNAICRHGAEVGCRVYTHHYNFSATAPFLAAHPEVLDRVVGAKRERKRLAPGWCDQRRLVHRNLCWNHPLYRQFLASCWGETMRKIEDLAGILVTPGENARCPCVECVGATDDPNAPFATSPERIATLASFVEVFAGVMRRQDRVPIVRAWAAGKARPWIEAFPRGVTYCLKDAFFDVVDAPPDPSIAEWVKAGHEILATPEIQGGENGGPMLWRDDGHLTRVVRECRELGASGFIACVNSEHGFLATPRRVQHYPLVMWAHAMGSEGAARDEADAAATALGREFDRSIFGAASDAIHDALIASSAVARNLPRVVFEPEEGYTWQFGYHLLEDRWPGRLGGSLDATPHFARELATLKELYAAVAIGGYDPPVDPARLAGKRDPIAYLAELRDGASQAEATLIALAEQIAADAAADYELVLISARLQVLLAEEWVALLAARACYDAALGAREAADRERYARASLAHLDATIAALDATIETTQRIDPGLVGDGLMKRVPGKRGQRVAERAAVAAKFGLGEAPRDG